MHKRALQDLAWPVALAVVLTPLLSCGEASPSAGSTGGGIWLTAGGDSGTTVAPTGAGGAGDDVTADDPDDDPDDGPDDGPEDGPDDGDTSPSVSFDVGAQGFAFCKYKDPGIYCRDNVAVECGDADTPVSEQSCVPDICQPGVGCVTCYAGQSACSGPHIMECNVSVSPAVWAIRETCEASAGQGCNVASGECGAVTVTGGVEPSGVYYQYAFFATGGVFRGGYDVDGFGNRLYVNRDGTIDVYEVELLDSDGDGQLEPNQHPNNRDEPGVVETRVLTFIEALPWPSAIEQAVSEIYASEAGLWVGGQNIEAMAFGGGGATQVITAPPSWAISFSQIGYDDVNQVWYASNEYNRRVFQHDAETDQWGLAFAFPSLSGDHMDGLEVVTQPETGIPFVYVSDMTSDFIAQYRLDPQLGWVQENLFEYEGTAGSLVEGMGYGAFNHFWTTGGPYLYEVGGGDLAEYTEPPG